MKNGKIGELTPDEILVHLAERLGLDQGERKLTAVFSDGKVRRLFIELGPLRPDELNRLASG